MEPIVLQFHGFVTDLRTVEKRSIIALTEITRDALRTHPHLAYSLANIIIDRILQASADLKLPALYLLDSITKTVGEPYTSYFAARLPEMYSCAWLQGAPGLHRPLDKLLTTWKGVFPPQILDAVRAAVVAGDQAGPPAQLPPAAAAYGAYPPPVYYAGGPKPMVPDPRLSVATAAAPMYSAYQQQPDSYPTTALPQAQPPPQPSIYAQQPPYGAPQQPQQQASYEQQPAPVPHLPSADLLALISSTFASAKPAVVAPKPGAGAKAPEAAVGGKPQTTEFSAERIKEHNPAAVSRLLSVTEHTKSSFLDRKFLRRQRHSTAARASRLWYIDIDTWISGTIRAVESPGAQKGKGGMVTTRAKKAAVAAATAPTERASVPADDEQTHCALSGERFEQFWDEGHQEWRFRDAKKLTAEEAARYGLEEGAIVLISALGIGIANAPTGKTGVKKEEDGAQRGVKREASPKEEDAETAQLTGTKKVKVET